MLENYVLDSIFIYLFIYLFIMVIFVLLMATFLFYIIHIFIK